MPTLTVNNFHGSMTPYKNGDINSGLTNVVEVFGQDPFNSPGVLTWNERAVQIDPTYSVITDMILCGKERVENGNIFVYAVGHTGRVYKIQVNDTATKNPDYDNPVLLTTISINTPTFTRGGFIDFYGATERIYIGHDKGVSRIDFDGTNEAFVGVMGSWTQNVPRPFVQFLGKMYVGNGYNLAEVDTTATVTTYTKLTPSFPLNTQVRDLDITPEGNYLKAVVSSLALQDITSANPDTSIIQPSDSYLFSWNGIDQGYTSYITYPATALSANCMFGDFQYVFGYDFRGGGIYNPTRKLLTSEPDSIFGESPSPNGVISMSGFVTWITTLPFADRMELIYCIFGTVSEYEVKNGYWCTYNQQATGSEDDILRAPFQILVSNIAQGAPSNGYTDGIFGRPRIYFSTLEKSPTTTKYKLYKWNPMPLGTGQAILGVYETQRQIFSKKVSLKEVRIYGEPWIANNSFTIDIIGSGGTPISGASYSFDTADSSLVVGEDFAWYNPQSAPTYAVGLRITNDGTSNFSINKVEIDWEYAGK